MITEQELRVLLSNLEATREIQQQTTERINEMNELLPPLLNELKLYRTVGTPQDLYYYMTLLNTVQREIREENVIGNEDYLNEVIERVHLEVYGNPIQETTTKNEHLMGHGFTETDQAWLENLEKLLPPNN